MSRIYIPTQYTKRLDYTNVIDEDLARVLQVEMIDNT